MNEGTTERRNPSAEAPYLPRLADELLARAMRAHGVVEVVGICGAGKSRTVSQAARSVCDLRDPAALARAEVDPTLTLAGTRPHGVVEWQLVPATLGLAERMAEADGPGPVAARCLLTRSGIPRTGGEAAAQGWHVPDGAGAAGAPDGRAAGPGAGRAVVRMLPMTLAESGDSTGEVSLTELFGAGARGGADGAPGPRADGGPGAPEPPAPPDGASAPFAPRARATDAPTLSRLSSRGGWPEAVTEPGSSAEPAPSAGPTPAERALEAALSAGASGAGLDPATARLFLRGVAATLGTAATYSQLRSVMAKAAAELGGTDTGGAGAGRRRAAAHAPTPKTLARYDEALRELGLLVEVPGWAPRSRCQGRSKVKGRRFFADPSLVAAATGRDPRAMLDSPALIRATFKNLCMRDLCAYAPVAAARLGAPGARVMYYHDDSGLDIDAILELADGRWAAFRLEPSAAGVRDAVRSLTRLRRKLCEGGAGTAEAARAAGTGPGAAAGAPAEPEPAFLCAVVGVSHGAYRTPEGVYVVPVTMLGA